MPETVRAKFTVDAKRETLHWQKDKGTLVTVEMSPVMSGSPENVAFYEATPGGKIELGTLNGDAAKAFELGKSYYVDFTPAE